MNRFIFHDAITRLTIRSRPFDQEAAATVAAHLDDIPKVEGRLRVGNYIVWQRGNYVFWRKGRDTLFRWLKKRIEKEGDYEFVYRMPRRFFLKIVNGKIKTFGASRLRVEHGFLITAITYRHRVIFTAKDDDQPEPERCLIDFTVIGWMATVCVTAVITILICAAITGWPF